MTTETPAVVISACGPSRGPCVCRCGHKPGPCNLPILECLASDHWGRECGHVWDGPAWESEDGRMSSATCSRCGMTAMSHDMWVGP